MTSKSKKEGRFSKEIIGLTLMGFGILYSLSLISYKMGIVGLILRSFSFSLMGFGGYIIPLLLIGFGIILFLDKLDTFPGRKSIMLILLVLSFLIFLDGPYSDSGNLLNKIKASIRLAGDNKGGGLIGSFLGYFHYKLFGKIGGYFILFCIFAINSLVLFDVKVKKLLKNTYNKIQNKKKTKATSNKQKSRRKKDNLPLKNKVKISTYTEQSNPKKLNKVKDLGKPQVLLKDKEEEKIDVIPNASYTIPSLDLLKTPEVIESGDHKKEVLKNAQKIEETMDNFGIDATVTQINKGPTITCYELSPSPGIKLSRIVSLSDNIALSLASSDIRIEAPIPGKSAVGIEVPNRIKDSVFLKEILLSDEYQNSKSSLPLALGKDVTGKTIVSSIDSMPHLLIAGATGSGKSVCINTIIMNIIYKSSPEDVRLLLIDPKVVELNVYNSIPHLLIPVVTDAKKAAAALNWAVNEMEKRYKLFAENNVRDMASYNLKIQKEENEKLPNIVIIIDELADLMMVAAQEIEDYISRLAQMARAAGIYLIVATQRPSVDVITGTIKANIPSRISFAVSSQVDSRTILDMSGAEKLLGKGDMLFYPSSYSKPLRIQGAFVSSEEVESVVNVLKENYETIYEEEVVEVLQNNQNINVQNQDDLLPDAIKLVLEEGQASISLLQRKLRIGYARAARIIDEMESQDIIGGYEGSKPRKVLISKEDYETLNI